MSRKYTAQEMRDMAENILMSEDDWIEDAGYMLRQAADAMEREKKYEYIVEYETMYGWRKLGFCTYSSIEDAKSFICVGSAALQIPKRIRKRSVGEWEEVSDDRM